MEADSAAQTDDVDLWIRNHDIVQVSNAFLTLRGALLSSRITGPTVTVDTTTSTQESAFDRRRRQWTRELEMDDASCVPMSLDMLLRTIQLCYEAKVQTQSMLFLCSNPSLLHPSSICSTFLPGIGPPNAECAAESKRGIEPCPRFFDLQFLTWSTSLQGRADAAVIREKSSNELPTWHDAIFDFFLQRYGDLPVRSTGPCTATPCA